MKKFLAIALCALMVLALAACTKPDKPNEGGDTFKNEPHDVASLKIGVILVGDENEGYTYAHIEGFKAAMKELGIQDNQVIWKYVIHENAECYDTACQLVDDGCSIIFSNSYGHQSYMVQAAQEHPTVLFVPATGDTANVCKLANVVNIFPYTYESRYVSGVVAGMKLKELMDNGTVTDPYIGYVGAYPYAEVVSGYTAFFLGIRSIVPEAHMDVQYTGKWFDLTAEAEAANFLMSRGCVIIGQHADSTGAPSAVQAKLDEGTVVYSVGYNIDMLNVAPTAALTSPQNNWGAYYTYAIRTAMNGETMKQDWCGGYAEDAVQISPLGPSCAAGTQEAVNDAIAKIKSGELHVFDCASFTVNGEHLTSYDRSYGFEGLELIWDGYFHESEKISAPLFDIRIDGITELNAESIG